MSVPEDVAASRRPRPLLSQRAEQQLGARHREILDQLEGLFLRDGFAGVSVRELASHVGCSRRTLYELAPSKDDLVLLVFDRFLHRVGRAALDSIDADQPFAEQIRAYFLGGMELQRISQTFSEDLADEPAARRLYDRHYGYVMAIVEQLVQRGVDAGEFRPVRPTVVAGLLAGGSQFFGRPDATYDGGLDEPAVEELLDLVIRAITVADR